ncbi:DUF3592 domain-containing protein [Kribbella sp. WER1]
MAAGEPRFERRVRSTAFLLAALVFTAIAYFQVHDTYLLKQRGEQVSGLVVHVHDGRSPYITVRYRTLGGDTITSDTSRYDAADPGETIDVVYDRKEPTRVQAADYGFDYWMAGVLAVIALGFLGLGVAGFRSRR